MKKITYLLLLSILTIPYLGRAQDQAGTPAKIWTYPVVYNLDEKISWYFDLDGTTFAKGQDLYLWAWSPSEPDAGNWESSSDFAKLTYVEEMLWKIELTPTEYFNNTVAQIKGSAGFWMRLKDKTGSKQSEVLNIPLPDISEFLASDNMYGVVPSKFNVKSPMGILFNANKTNSPADFTNAQSLHLHAGMNDWDTKIEYHAWEFGVDLPQSTEYTQLVDMGNGIYRKDLIPYQYFGVEEDYSMEKINFLVVIRDWSGTSPDGEFYAADVPIPPPPALSFFPLKVSKTDILAITRENNAKGQLLHYTIVGGNKTLTGEIPGAAARKRVFINLGKEFKDMELSKLSVTIKDGNDTVIYNGEIPLVTVDKPTK